MLKRLMLSLLFIGAAQPLCANNFKTQVSDTAGIFCRLSLVVGTTASALYGLNKLFNMRDQSQYQKKLKNDPQNAQQHKNELNDSTAGYEEDQRSLASHIKASALIGSVGLLTYALTRP